MDIEALFLQWQTFDEETKTALGKIKDNEKEKEDCFGKDLSFGTGGIRGKMGAGKNRINRYTVARITAGYGLFLRSRHSEKALKKGIIIAYDSRNQSYDFAALAAKILLSYGISARIFQEPTPTPMLSFAVPQQKALGGIVITASHNPKEYNGYKIYNQYGGQLIPSEAEEINGFVQPLEASPLLLPKEDKIVVPFVDDSVFFAYCNALLKERRNTEKKQLSIVYSPLHGVGCRCFSHVLKESGFTDVYLVKEQVKPDGSFPTVHAPNPEDADAMRLPISLAKRVRADIVLATDPDGDRIGVAVLHHGAYTLLTGNEVGALLLWYLLEHDKENKGKPYLIKTIVTGSLGQDIAKEYGAEVIHTLTGFKYIGAAILRLEQEKGQRFLFGYEESCGYLCGLHAKDKDGIVGGMLIAEMADAEKKQGFTLIDRLEMLYRKFGYRNTAVFSYECTETAVSAWQNEKMNYFRKWKGTLFAENPKFFDYLQGLHGLPSENVLEYQFQDGSWLFLRPSGTEEKLKIYIEGRGQSKVAAEHRVSFLKEIVENILLQIPPVFGVSSSHEKSHAKT